MVLPIFTWKNYLGEFIDSPAILATLAPFIGRVPQMAQMFPGDVDPNADDLTFTFGGYGDMRHFWSRTKIRFEILDMACTERNICKYRPKIWAILHFPKRNN